MRKSKFKVREIKKNINIIEKKEIKKIDEKGLEEKILKGFSLEKSRISSHELVLDSREEIPIEKLVKDSPPIRKEEPIEQFREYTSKNYSFKYEDNVKTASVPTQRGLMEPPKPEQFRNEELANISSNYEKKYEENIHLEDKKKKTLNLWEGGA